MNFVVITGMALSVLALVSLFQIVQYLRNWVYPPAQIPCIPILLFTVTLGWGHWAILLEQDYSLEIEYSLNIVKAAVLFCYFSYIKTLLGWEYELGVYNSEKIIPVLTTLGKLPGCLGWCKCSHINTELKARRFLNIVEVAIYQYMLVNCAIFVVGIYIDLGLDESEKYSRPLHVIRTISSVAALLSVIGLIVLTSRAPNLKGFGMGVKLIWIKIVMVITEAQPTLLLLFEIIGLLDTDSGSVTYLSSICVCFEMAILGSLQLIVFPVSNFKINPQSCLELEVKNNKTMIKNN